MSFNLRPSFYISVSVMMVCDTLLYFIVFFRVSSSQRDEGNVAECGTCSICSRFYVKTSKLWNVICNFVWREQSKTVRAMATRVVVANVKCFLEQKRDLPFATWLCSIKTQGSGLSLRIAKTSLCLVKIQIIPLNSFFFPSHSVLKLVDFFFLHWNVFCERGWR